MAYERRQEEIGDNRSEILARIFENSKYLYGNISGLTRIARHALLTQAQVEMYRSSESLDENSISKCI